MVSLVADHGCGGTAAIGTPFTGRDAGRLQLAQSIFWISDIRRVHGGLRDSSSVAYLDRVVWARFCSGVVTTETDDISGLEVFLVKRCFAFFWVDVDSNQINRCD